MDSSTNCGYDAHEGVLYRTEKDYDGREYKIEVCRHCRYEDKASINIDMKIHEPQKAQIFTATTKIQRSR